LEEEPVADRLELRAQGIEVGVEVAYISVSPEQAVHTALFGMSELILGGRRQGPRRGFLGDALFAGGRTQIEGPPPVEIAEKGPPAAADHGR